MKQLTKIYHEYESTARISLQMFGHIQDIHAYNTMSYIQINGHHITSARALAYGGISSHCTPKIIFPCLNLIA